MTPRFRNPGIVGGWLIAGVFLATQAGAQESPPAEDISTIRRHLLELSAEYKAAEEPLQEQLGNSSGEARAALREQLRQLPYQFASRFVDIARQDPAHEDAFGPLLWCIVKLESGEDLDTAIVLLGEHFKTVKGNQSLNLYVIVPELVDKESAEVDSFLEAMASTYQDEFSAGNVLCGLAQRRKEHAGRSGVADDVAAAEKLLREIIERYGDVRIRSGLAKELAAVELEDLCGVMGIGRTAPEIEGEDLESVSFKLSDYAGRVVVLSFSGHWCGPCRRAHHHLQALVEKHSAAPFTLIEVNSDKDPVAVQAYMQEHGLTWGCFADKATDGPISTAWGIHSWPRICVIDKQGVIRHKAVDPPHDELEMWVAALLEESQ